MTYAVSDIWVSNKNPVWLVNWILIRIFLKIILRDHVFTDPEETYVSLGDAYNKLLRRVRLGIFNPIVCAPKNNL
jgi:hypothetical protein